MLSPIITVFKYYPLRAFITIIMMLIISAIALKVINRNRNNDKASPKIKLVLWILINYSMLILFFTVLGRRSLDYYRYNFDFGYSYREIFILGNYRLASQIIVNIFMFVPVGIMCSAIVNKFVLIKSLFCGFILSFFIEVLQLVLKRGYFEFDDLISNVLGILLGYLLVMGYNLVKKIRYHCKKK